MVTVPEASGAGGPASEQEPVPDTYFAPAGRASADDLRSASEVIAKDPLASALMRISGEVVAILNSERQILSVNDGLLKLLGVAEVEGLVGLRPGEALHCIHAWEHPGGCGTSRACTDCGAVIAIVLAQNSGHPVDRECRIVIDQGTELCRDLMVRAVPFQFESERLVALILHDRPPRPGPETGSRG